MSQKKICIDFDGCLHSYISGYLGVAVLEAPTPGALEFVNWLITKYKVEIFTTRAKTPEGVQAIKAWLKEHGFPDLGITDKKGSASLFIDDRAYRFDGSWQKLTQYLTEENPDLKTWVNQNGQKDR